MHLNEGEIHAYQDQELAPHQAQRIAAHLATCARCQSLAKEIETRSQSIQASLTSLETGPAHTLRSTALAHARFEQRIQQTHKEQQTMQQKIFSRASRPAWAALTIIVLLAVAMLVPSVQTAANSFLGLFRVQQIKVVQLNSDALPNTLGNSSELQKMFSSDVQTEPAGEPKQVGSAQEASAQTGFAVRLPAELGAPAKINVQPGGKMVMTIDRSHIQALLAEIGRSDIQVPAIADGAKVTLAVPAGVNAMYGECNFPDKKPTPGGPDQGQPEPRRFDFNCTTLMQMHSPTVDAPPGLDLQQIGQAYLEVLGMSKDEAAHFASTVDWTTTFVIPIPSSAASYQDVSVDGVPGTFIQQHGTHYLLLWVKDDIVYALAGPGDAEAAQKIANSLQ